MNVKHPMDVLHSFSIQNIFYDKVDLKLFYFRVAIYLVNEYKFKVNNKQNRRKGEEKK